MADSDPGFVLDEASGLYCHAGSGFYHDPNAGWYYNTHDGVYYSFEDGKYVPISSETQHSPSQVGCGSLNSDGKEEISSVIQKTGKCDNHEGPSEKELASADSGENLHESDVREGAELDSATGMPVEDEYPLWYFDTVRSMYWYYDKATCAYYMFQGEDHSGAGLVSSDETFPGTTCSQEEHTGREGPISCTSNHDDVGRLHNEETSADNGNVETFQPTSGWVEEALIELYLKGYPRESSVKDDGPWITSADIFNETQHASSHANSEVCMGSSYSNGSSTLGYDEQMWYTSQYHNTTQELQLPSNDSDNDGSQELEEGEWVPDEPLRIIDGEEGESFSFSARNGEEEEEEEEVVSGLSSQLQVASHDYHRSSEEIHDFYQQSGEAVKQSDIDDLDMEDGEISLEDEQKNEEEQWQAQYGQVVRDKFRDYVIPGAVDLWDWAILDKESKTLKQGKVKKQVVVGRIVSSVTRLHPSLSGTSGCIRTTAIIAAELEFVKVSSGKIYRLRRPSRKHLAAVGTYDSSNPTKNLGLPAIGLAALDTTEEKLTSDGNSASDQPKGRADSLLSKPFIPNTGHWRFQRLLPTKKGRGVPAALIASRYLSPEEMLINEQRKQRYRDRAAERRNLHGGFGVGPGQKGLSVIEQEKLDADEAVDMAGALQKAAAAPPLGRENVGKRMLEGMGWKEGQTLGLEGGLVKPLQAQGNVGRAGLGWG